MRRADRLFQLVQIIRGRRLTTAAFLAQRLEVSERTIYRDVADLQAQGVPLEGEAGVGYRLGAGFDLPPLLFTAEEAMALVASVRLAQPWLDPALARAAELALGRVMSVLPSSTRAAAQALPLFAPPVASASLNPTQQQGLQQWREATQARQRVSLQYRDAEAQASQRSVRPLGCFYWGGRWTLAAWCELRQDFRSFRLDRLVAVEVQALPQGRFADETGRTLADYLRSRAPAEVVAQWQQQA
ncbi:helix-turn-helix transcriptional regulator [Ideonella sp.]|jgi:predicted DNA-binding transcriptional regulator YafY|uniref:helix-turn-helix transcriptional regulator n=1 Tax=Ideonella sp. TaxID=1929293 RepID=UPI0037BF0AE3